MIIKQLKLLAKQVSLLTLDISYLAKTGHVGSALSISDILTVLYFSKMNISSTNINKESRDRFILSKGHAAAALYSILYKKGLLSKKELFSFGDDVDGLCEHPEIKNRGVEMTSGSLGHGLAFAAGIAQGLKLKGEKSNVYVLISDGECGEGSVWEAALLVARLKLDNLTVILDYNKWQCFGPTRNITLLEPLKIKWEAFGWKAIETDGHNIGSLKSTLERIPFYSNKPSIIIAHTISGRGISLIENQLIGHYKVFTKEEYLASRKELEKL